jgi:hypothetical protein
VKKFAFAHQQQTRRRRPGAALPQSGEEKEMAVVEQESGMTQLLCRNINDISQPIGCRFKNEWGYQTTIIDFNADDGTPILL